MFVDGPPGATTNAGAYRLRITPYDPVPPPTNDTCSAAKVLVMPTNAIGVIREQGDTSAATNDALGCSASGPDLVYQFNLLQPRQVLARVTPLAGSSLRPVTYLRPTGACSSEAAGDQLQCQVASSPGSSVTTVIPNLPIGTWSFWVDGALGTGGPFDLQHEFALPPAPPPNDACAGAIPLSLASGAVNAQGTTLGANVDTNTCTIPLGTPSPDVVYQVTMPLTKSLSIDLKATVGSSLKPVATLRSPGACSSTAAADQLACSWATDPQFIERAVSTIPQLDAGVYFLWVSGDDGSQGPFSLRLSTSDTIPPPSNDVCSPGLPPLLAPGVPQVGDTRGAKNDDYASGCNLPLFADGIVANDVVYRFTLATTQSVTLTVVPDPTEGQLFRPVMYVRSGSSSCSVSSATKGCTVAASYGGTATLTINNLVAGTYTAWVDGAGQSSGKFTIKLQ